MDNHNSASTIEQHTVNNEQKYEIIWGLRNWHVGSQAGTWSESEPLTLTKSVKGQPSMTWILKLFPRGPKDEKKPNGSGKPLLEPILMHTSASEHSNNPVAPRLQFKWSFEAYNGPLCMDKASFAFNSNEITIDANGGGCWKECIGGITSSSSDICIKCAITCCFFDGEGPRRVLSRLSVRHQECSLTIANCQSLGDDLKTAVAPESPIKSVEYVKVSFGNGESLHAMKSILQVRSPVFRAMFSHDCLEQRTGELKLDDCVDKTAVTGFFGYIHSGRLCLRNSPDLGATLNELLYLANKYCVNCLLSDLQSCLLENICLMRQHLVLLTDLSYLYQLPRLKVRCIELARMGSFPNKEDRSEVDALKAAVVRHKQLAFDLLQLD